MLYACIGKKLYPVLVFLLLFEASYSQEVENRSLQDFVSDMRFSSSNPGNFSPGSSESAVEGSEYFDPEFVNGEILTLKAEHFSGIPVRYNAYRDDIEVKHPDGNIFIIKDPSVIFQVLIKDNTLIFTKFNDSGNEQSGFLFLLFDGKNSLFCRQIKTLKERIPSNGIIPETPAKIIDKPREYYLRLNDGLPRVFNSKSDFLDLLDWHKDEAGMFIRKQKIKMNDEKDLVRLMAFLESL